MQEIKIICTFKEIWFLLGGREEVFLGGGGSDLLGGLGQRENNGILK